MRTNTNESNKNKETNCAQNYDLGFQNGYRAGSEDSWGKGYDIGYSSGFSAGVEEAKASHALYGEGGE